MTNSLNNTYMVRITKYVDNVLTVLGGGTAVIGQTNTLEINIPDGGGTMYVKAKAYNNQYTSYSDPYYDDASNVSSALNANLWRNAVVNITVNGTSNATITYGS